MPELGRSPGLEWGELSCKFSGNTSLSACPLSPSAAATPGQASRLRELVGHCLGLSILTVSTLGDQGHASGLEPLHREGAMLPEIGGCPHCAPAWPSALGLSGRPPCVLCPFKPQFNERMQKLGMATPRAFDATGPSPGFKGVSAPLVGFRCIPL